MNWVNCEEKYPDCDEIIAYDEVSGETFNMTLIESKWGNFYRDDNFDMRDYTHWKPREKG